MNFAINHIKIKSNWFIEDGVFSKIKYDAFYLYIQLHRFHVPNQDNYTYVTSLKQLRLESGYSKDITLELLKRLIRFKIVSCSVTRWDRHNESDLIIIGALDIPKTTRKKVNRNGKELDVDVPDTPDDMYVSLDLRLMQHYIQLGFDGREMGLNCLINKLSHNTEGKSWMSVNSMAEILGLSNDKVSKMIYSLNRNYLMLSQYKKNGYQIVKGKRQIKYSFEHKICHNINLLDAFSSGWIKETIDKNVVKWDKRNKNKKGKKLDIGNPDKDDTILDTDNIQDVQDVVIDWQSDNTYDDSEYDFNPF